MSLAYLTRTRQCWLLAASLPMYWWWLHLKCLLKCHFRQRPCAHSRRCLALSSFLFLGTKCCTSQEMVLVSSETSCEAFWQKDLGGRQENDAGQSSNVLMAACHVPFIDLLPDWCRQYKVKSLLPIYSDAMSITWHHFHKCPSNNLLLCLLTLWMTQINC